MMKCCGSAGLSQVLGSGLVELLTNEVHDVSLGIAASPNIHANETYAYTTRLSTTRDSQRQSSMRKTEPVEDFELSSSESEADDVPPFNVDLPFGNRNEIEEEISSSSSLSTEASIFNPPSRNPSEEIYTNDTQGLFFEETTVEQIEKYIFLFIQPFRFAFSELFGNEPDHISHEPDLTEDDDWPSELSVHGDVDEDGRRWEEYRAQKKFQNGRISLEEMRNQLAALSTTSATEEDFDEPLPVVPRRHVPALNFDRLRSAPAALISDIAAGQIQNPPFEDSPSMSNPPDRSTEHVNRQLHSTVSIMELSPVQIRYGSLFDGSKRTEANGRLALDDELHLATVEFLIELLIAMDRFDDQKATDSGDLVGSISTALFHDVNGHHFRKLTPKLLKRVHNRGQAAIRMIRQHFPISQLLK